MMLLEGEKERRQKNQSHYLPKRQIRYLIEYRRIKGTQFPTLLVAAFIVDECGLKTRKNTLSNVMVHYE